MLYLRLPDKTCRKRSVYYCLISHHFTLHYILLTGTLSADLTHYAIPDVLSLSEYLEVFEQPGIRGCVLLQTVLTHVCRLLA